MANGSIRQGDELAFLGKVIREKMEGSPKTRKFANTVTVAIGVAVTAAGQALALPLDLPQWAMWIILAVTLIGTLFGVSVTQNGWSPSQIKKLEQWMAEYIDENHSLVGVEEVGAPSQEYQRQQVDLSDGLDSKDLQALVSNYINHRRTLL